MKNYYQTAPMSCVHDSFVAARIPTSTDMLYGYPYDKTIQILKAHGYKVYEKGSNVIFDRSVPLFIITIIDRDTLHVEYHINTFDMAPIPPESLAAVAVK